MKCLYLLWLFMMTEIINVPVLWYTIEIHIWSCKDYWDSLKARWKDIDDYYDCLWFQWSDKKDIFICVEDNNLSTLLHEYCHAIFYMMDYIGMPYDKKNEEMYSYIMEYLYTETKKSKLYSKLKK